MTKKKAKAAQGGTGDSNLPAKVTGGYAILTGQPKEIREIIQANIAGGFGITEFNLDRVRVPLGGATAWQIPTLEGSQSRESMSGIILYYKDQRAYWEQGLDQTGGGMPPDCTSADGETGRGEPGGACAQCPHSQWGSSGENRRGQACRTVRMMFVVPPDGVIPLVLSVPPSSLKSVIAYFLRLASNRIPYYGCITKFSLNPIKMSGFDVAQIVPTMEARLTPEEMSAIKDIAKSLIPAIKKAQPEEGDFKEGA